MIRSFLDATTAAQGGPQQIILLVVWIVVLGGMFYFMLIRPQRKQQKQMDALVSSLEDGDSVLTTSGVYGVISDVMDEVSIVEFGNNKNCRIPMKKTSVVEVEKANGGAAKENKDSKESK